jgi:outer membrane protein TolC
MRKMIYISTIWPKKYFLLFVLIVFPFGNSLFAQDESIDSLYRSTNYIFPELPSFKVVYDSVMSRSPQKLKLQETKLEALYSLGIVKKEWMNYLSLNTNFNYGKGGALGVTELPTGGSVSSFSNSTTSTYGGGVGLGFTLGAILTYKSKVKIAKVKVTQAQYEMDVFAQELRFKLFEQYTQLENDLAAYKANSIVLEMSNIQIMMQEKQFKLNRIDLSELISARLAYNGIVATNETLKRSCRIGLHYFEQLSGINFLTYSNSKQPQK